MPQENQSGKLGNSPSKVHESVIQNSKNVQQPVSVPAVTKSGQYNKEPVKVPR